MNASCQGYCGGLKPYARMTMVDGERFCPECYATLVEVRYDL
jgi:hypothetical protein